MSVCIAHIIWKADRASQLDQFEQIHRSIGKTGSGTQDARQQINQAYVLMLSAQFQGFCRDLHSEAVDFLVDALQTTSLRSLLQSEFQYGRKLDSGNPTLENIRSDFKRLGFDILSSVKAINPALDVYRSNLLELNHWRNAIAHQDFDLAKLGGARRLRHSQIRAWRRSCDALANSFVAVVSSQLATLTGRIPW
jgi:hypothetical protein